MAVWPWYSSGNKVPSVKAFWLSASSHRRFTEAQGSEAIDLKAHADQVRHSRPVGHHALSKLPVSLLASLKPPICRLPLPHSSLHIITCLVLSPGQEQGTCVERNWTGPAAKAKVARGKMLALTLPWILPGLTLLFVRIY